MGFSFVIATRADVLSERRCGLLLSPPSHVHYHLPACAARTIRNCAHLRRYTRHHWCASSVECVWTGAWFFSRSPTVCYRIWMGQIHVITLWVCMWVAVEGSKIPPQWSGPKSTKNPSVPSMLHIFLSLNRIFVGSALAFCNHSKVIPIHPMMPGPSPHCQPDCIQGHFSVCGASTSALKSKSLSIRARHGTERSRTTPSRQLL